MNYVMHVFRIQLDGIEIVTVIRKFTHCKICRPQHVSAYFPLVSHHFSNSRFHVHPHGMLWSQSLCDLCFTAFKFGFKSKTAGDNAIQTFQWNECSTNWLIKRFSPTCSRFCFNLKCGVKIYIGICLYPREIKCFHLARVRHYYEANIELIRLS